MRFLRIPATPTLGVLVFVFGSFTVAPTRACVNDISVVFGFCMVAPVSFANFVVFFIVIWWVTGMGEYS